MALLTQTVSALGHVLPGTRSNRLLILIYHRVHPRPDPMFPGEVDAERFDWQMSLLRRYCHPVRLADGVERLKRGDLPNRAVAVTFDDGYADNAAVALPILRKNGVPATFFIATGFLDGGRMWNDSIIEAIRRVPQGKLDLQGVGIGPVLIEGEDDRRRLAENLLKTVKHQQPAQRQLSVERVCQLLDAELPTNLMMSSDQVRQLAAAGMEIGAHTVTHPILRLLSDAEAQREVRDSRVALEAIINGRVSAFAYPNGRPGDDYSSRDRDLVASLGFDFALSTRWGAAASRSDVYQLPRFTPWDATPPRWLARLLSAFQRRD